MHKIPVLLFIARGNQTRPNNFVHLSMHGTGEQHLRPDQTREAGTACPAFCSVHPFIFGGQEQRLLFCFYVGQDLYLYAVLQFLVIRVDNYWPCLVH